MSSASNTPPPRTSRAKHQHSKSATQVAPNNNSGKSAQRRQKANRANYNDNNGNAQRQNNQADLSVHKSPSPAHGQTQTFADSAVLSSEYVHIPTGLQNSKNHTQSQSASDRVFSRTNVPASSLTDSELGQNNLSATPAKSQGAYAGPTFHASPAPSALPVPKFLSKSVPASKPQPGFKSSSEDGSDSAPSPTPSPPSPSRAPIPILPRDEESPLDFFFKADREEKARKATGSPASTTFSNSPNQFSVNGKMRHSKQNSHSSLNAVFAIELDADGKGSQPSPPAATPVAHRSVTAPSKVQQAANPVEPDGDSKAIKDLFDRLSLSQKKPITSTPSRTVDRIPSEPSSRYHTPSPFYDGRNLVRSTSGPTTPAPAANDTSDFFYGNRNLSPLFKAAKADSVNRNSRLRTEITADSPTMPQGEFPPVNGANKMDSSATPNNRRPRTPGKRSFNPCPDSYPYANGTNGAPISFQKANATIPFIPSSVQAKQHVTKPPDTLSLEQDLKRILNLNTAPGNMSGVR
ncbi:hypothetical protein K469DRAFT_588164 [Zopfia rhizophila CBS 207.26]|uniref:Proteophosphoglycan 5 n=1 Tax=Zopfia rhizophila CBS 207.26 TaxID=1314779 RepID=A0A6A6DQR4_9PEZI|nr:hypothetical protein K469DRAFT_588164 [Zopfia rhizophila CBS 207.26]